jgi:hypothetical protein
MTVFSVLQDPAVADRQFDAIAASAYQPRRFPLFCRLYTLAGDSHVSEKYTVCPTPLTSVSDVLTHAVHQGQSPDDVVLYLSPQTVVLPDTLSLAYDFAAAPYTTSPAAVFFDETQEMFICQPHAAIAASAGRVSSWRTAGSAKLCRPPYFVAYRVPAATPRHDEIRGFSQETAIPRTSALLFRLYAAKAITAMQDISPASQVCWADSSCDRLSDFLDARL